MQLLVQRWTISICADIRVITLFAVLMIVTKGALFIPTK